MIIIPFVVVWSSSCVWLFATLCTIAHQAPLSLGFSRWEYWSGVVMSSSRGSSWPRDYTRVSCIAGGFFTTEPPRKPHYTHYLGIDAWSCVFFFFFATYFIPHWSWLQIMFIYYLSSSCPTKPICHWINSYVILIFEIVFFYLTFLCILSPIPIPWKSIVTKLYLIFCL